jgi:hypothetical protein
MFKRILSLVGAGQKHAYDKPVFAQPYCPLEILAEEAGAAITDKIFSESCEIKLIADSLIQFLNDEEGERALKKALHIVIEERMRSMAVTLDDPRHTGFDRLDVNPSPHPLDHYCAVALGRLASEDVVARLKSLGWRLGLTAANRVALRMKLLAAVALVVWRVSAILVSRGVTRVEPHQTVALVSNFWGIDQFEGLADAVADAGFDQPGQMTMLVERPQPLPSRGFEFIYPSNLKVPRMAWCRRVLWPVWRQAAGMCRRVFASKDETVFAAFEALRITSTALEVWPIAMNVRCQTVSDVIDYLPAISVKSAIYRKFGAKLVRWPTTQIDTFGCLFSNLPHDFFVSSGNYLSSTFSANWRNPDAGRAIGLVPSDKRLASATRVDPEFLDRVERLRKDRKLLAYFGPSPETGVTPMIVSGLRAVIEVLERNPEWFLVIKSKRRLVDREKGRTAYLGILSDLPEFPAWKANERIIFVDYADDRQEVCPSGWLVDVMDLATGDHGSLVGECVARSRPYCSYAPAVYNTPFKKKLLDAEVLITDLEKFKVRLDAAMKGDIPLLPKGWSEWAFDPFQDDRALERLGAIILNDGKVS